jgi:hypothetical protein
MPRACPWLEQGTCIDRWRRRMIWTRSSPGGRSAHSTRNPTLHYDRMMLLLDPTSVARGLVRKKVEVVNYPDGRFAVQYNGATLGFKVFDKIQTVQPGAIVDNKRLSAVLEQVKAQQAAYPARQQRGHMRGSDRRTTSRRQVCRQRGGRHATVLPRRPPEAAIRTVLIATAAFVFHLI